MEVKERVEALRDASAAGARIGLTELARSNAWRAKLAEQGALEIVDRVDPTAYLLSVDAMNELLDTINALESELERATLQMMFVADGERERNWESGAELEQGALDYLHRNAEAIQDILSEARDERHQ
ncbi:hypothetical protein BLEM_1837 [Bifidobacterium lemurum]|uniref:Uncharacterized protein n=1 Tax=Bifidobacterium lemurum TaxID=1603886 RepID=A0A261FNY6_9BIFI|nr:hypothetical protein [Bifidobacterium lemurum]OZG60536.1 hypothetical protein BLEM_1837 [Bifidobacterium lemurum]QOL34449.1 hypothetical protein BL8807_00460 [Bifidobacterium lemurum]